MEICFWDLNQDGSDELLIGDGKTIAAVYYLKNNQPTLLHVAYVASAGGYRSSLDLLTMDKSSMLLGNPVNPEMELTLYSLGKGEAKEEKKATIQIGGKETAEQALGISAKKLDLSKLDWKNLMVQGIPNQQRKQKRKIRKLPSTS